MVTARSYVEAVAERLDATTDDFAMLPTLLAVACVDVLPIAGASLSLISDIRLPLGASDPTAALAEQIQVTLGTGPCLASAHQGEPLTNDEGTMAIRWPVFHHELRGRTPYRSVQSLPLVFGSYVGALDLYSTDPTASEFPAADEVWTTVGVAISDLLVDVPTAHDRIGLELPSWLISDTIDSRLDLWVAVGMIMQHGGRHSDDALALLRAHAFIRSQTLDETADDLIHRRITADDVEGA